MREREKPLFIPAVTGGIGLVQGIAAKNEFFERGIPRGALQTLIAAAIFIAAHYYRTHPNKSPQIKLQ